MKKTFAKQFIEPERVKRIVYSYPYVLAITWMLGMMFAFCLSFTILGRVNNLAFGIFATVVIGGIFFYYLHNLSKLTHKRRSK